MLSSTTGLGHKRPFSGIGTDTFSVVQLEIGAGKKSLSWRHLIAVGLLMAASTIAYTANGTHEALRVELLKMAADDQDVRQVTEKVDFRRWKAVDFANRARMKEIVSNFGWPTYEMVGKDGANAAWLLVQHADSDNDFQLEVLELI